MSRTDGYTLKTIHTCPGRAVFAERDGALYVGRNYEIHRSTDGGATWTLETAMPRPFSRRVAECSRLLCRALRQEVRAMTRLCDGSYIAASKKGIHYARPGERLMRDCRVEGTVGRLKPPMMIGVGPNERVVWGEYSTTNRDRPEVRLYASDDRGATFHIVYAFPADDVRHIHNIFYDAKGGHYWVLTGDHGAEPGFIRISADFKSSDWLVRGKQDYRAVCAFDFGDHFIYGTDTEHEPNFVMRLNKRTGHAERIAPLAGTCIYACRFGGLYALSTTVEISKANPSRDATLLLSRDGDRWQTVMTARKDLLPQKLFQWGSLILPRGESDQERLIVSGQALRRLDGKTQVIEVS